MTTLYSPASELLSLGSRMPLRLFILLIAACLMASAQKPIGEVRATDASLKGNVIMGKDGAVLTSGSQVQAGSLPAQIKLARGGDVTVCPNSSVTVNASKTGDELMFAMSNGTLETHYKLPARSDAVLTPDFRIQLSGPGTFHLAVDIRKNNDMCVESLPGNTSAAIITETFGDGTYQLQAGKSVVFHNGKVDGATENAAADCRCPLLPAIATPPQFDPGLKFPEDESRRAEALTAKGEPMPVPMVANQIDNTQPGKVYAKVDAPIVFNGNMVPFPTDERRNAMMTLPIDLNPYPKVIAPADIKKAVPEQPQAANPQPNNKAKPKEEPKKKWYQRWGDAISKIFK
jgi:hypothetical protein